MKQKEVFKKIGGIITELSDQYEYLKTVTDDLNDLELELFAANAHFLADHIEVLCKLNLQKQADKADKKAEEKPAKTEEKAAKAEKVDIPAPVKPSKPLIEPPAAEPKYFEPVVQQMKFPEKAEEKPAEPVTRGVEFEIAGVPVDVSDVMDETTSATAQQHEEVSVTEPEPETIRHELILDESMLLDDDEPLETEIETVKESRKRRLAVTGEEKPADESPQAAAEDVRPVAVVLAEVAVEEVLTINQKISAQAGDKSISRTEQMSIKPISDLKLAITLNDKLLYVKDLFNGYNLAYSEAIEILNRFTTFDEAARFLKTNYVTKNNWDSKPATTEKFYALLKRRYA